MKKFLIAVALITAFGGSSVYAQPPTDPKTPVSTTVTGSFKEIKADELPQAVKDALAKKYDGKTIKTAYVMEAAGVKTYKVTLSEAEGKTSDVLLNEKGEVLPNMTESVA